MGCLETAGLCVGGKNFGILVVLAAVLVYIPVAGLLNSFGIFVEELNERFCPTDCIQLLSWIGALTFGANRLFAWVTVALQRVFPPLVLFLAGVVLASGGLLASSYVRELGYLFATYCALFGVGSSLVMTSPYALIEEYFPLSHRYHLLATSIMNVGGPVGALVMNPLAAYLDTVEEHTWRSTLRILAVVTFLMGSVCAIFMRRRRYDVSQVESTVTSSGPGGDRKSYEAMEDERCVDKDKPVYSVRDVINFFLWVTAIFFLSFGIYIPKVHFIQFMTNLHIDKQEAARCMSYEGLSEAVLSFLIALLGGGLQRHLLLCYVVCSLMLCVASGLLLLASRIIHIAVYVTVHGAVDGMTLTILYTAVSGLTRDITTKRYLWSATYFVNGLGQILGIPLAGLVFDRTKSYHLVFIIASITFGSSMFLFAILAYRQHRHGQDVLPPSIEKNIPPATSQSPPQTATEAPTQTSTEGPTQTPTETPTEAPTQSPTQTPTQAPTTTDDTAVPVHEKSKGSFFKSRKQDPEKIPLAPTDPKDANETTTAK